MGIFLFQLLSEMIDLKLIVAYPKKPGWGNNGRRFRNPAFTSWSNGSLSQDSKGFLYLNWLAVSRISSINSMLRWYFGQILAFYYPFSLDIRRSWLHFPRSPRHAFSSPPSTWPTAFSASTNKRSTFSEVFGKQQEAINEHPSQKGSPKNDIQTNHTCKAFGDFFFQITKVSSIFKKNEGGAHLRNKLRHAYMPHIHLVIW